jgi:hypothetical protein
MAGGFYLSMTVFYPWYSLTLVHHEPLQQLPPAAIGCMA